MRVCAKANFPHEGLRGPGFACIFVLYVNEQRRGDKAHARRVAAIVRASAATAATHC